jgi:hypothetical protein
MCHRIIFLTLPQDSRGAYLCLDGDEGPHQYLARDLRRALQPLGTSQVLLGVRMA